MADDPWRCSAASQLDLVNWVHAAWVTNNSCGGVEETGELYDITIDTLPDDWPTFERRLRASRGEGGLSTSLPFESKRNRTFVYAQSPNAGLMNLTNNHRSPSMKMLLTSRSVPPSSMQSCFVDSDHAKTVVDGSNTSGFNARLSSPVSSRRLKGPWVLTWCALRKTAPGN